MNRTDRKLFDLWVAHIQSSPDKIKPKWGMPALRDAEAEVRQDWHGPRARQSVVMHCKDGQLDQLVELMDMLGLWPGGLQSRRCAIGPSESINGRK